MSQAKPVIQTSCQLDPSVHCKQSVKKMLVLRLAQLQHRKWEFQNICCLIQGCYIYLFICNKRLRKRSAICQELMVNCWWKMVIDYCRQYDDKRHPTSQQLQELLSAVAQHPQTCSVSSHTMSSAISLVPPGPGAGGVACTAENMGLTPEMNNVLLLHQVLVWHFSSLLAVEPGESPSELPKLSAPLLVHLFMPTMHLGPAAIDSLYTESSTFS